MNMRKVILLILGLFSVGGVIVAQDTPEDTPKTIFQKQIDETQEDREGFSQTLIDFSEFDPEYDKATEIDYSNFLTAFTLSSEELEQLKMTYGINSWMIRPRSSIEFPDIIKNSFVRAVVVNDTAQNYAGETILGARIAFPEYPFEMFAEIVPPFRANHSGDAFVGKGLLNNVGIVRSAYITVYGLNQPERLYVVTEDVTGNEYEYSFGDLKFIGWKTLEWANPNYLRDIRSRELQSMPLYPQASSNRRLKAIKVVRSGSIYGGADFVTYIKDIKLTFDKAVDDELIGRDFDNEGVWGIVEKRIGIRDSVLYKRGLVQHALEYLEKRKKYNYPEDSKIDSTGGSDQQTTDDQTTAQEEQGQ